MTSLLGHTPKELIGTKMVDVVWPEERDVVDSFLKSWRMENDGDCTGSKEWTENYQSVIELMCHLRRGNVCHYQSTNIPKSGCSSSSSSSSSLYEPVGVARAARIGHRCQLTVGPGGRTIRVVCRRRFSDRKSDLINATYGRCWKKLRDLTVPLSCLFPY